MGPTTLAKGSLSHIREMMLHQWLENPLRRPFAGMMFVLAMQPITPVEANSPSYCVWRGTGPMCDGECNSGEEESGRSAHPPGESPCWWSGTKVLCCKYPPPTPREIRSTAAANRCLDADLGTIGGNGTKVQLWECLGGQNQKWLTNRNGTIVNAQSNRCLDADLNTIGQNGTIIQLWDCWGGKNQNWTFTISQRGEGFPPAGLQNEQGFTSNVLDADLGTIASNGTKIQLWENFYGPNQQWTDSNFYIKILQGKRCLDADLGTIGENGTVVQLWDCLGGQNQQWQVNSDGTIVNAQSHRCLDADLNTIGENRTVVQLWDCLGGQNQKWKFQSNGAPISPALHNVQSNRCLDGDLGTIGENGTKVQLWDCLGGQNQKWEQQQAAQ
ncbi:ricin-type beta-trefoil lectin domain protein [Methylocystis sp. IM3]|uniref:RICIN domain-containing protein n=1 Tax=unclassified Methylocystis TaxID=2625913 RepID=UPI0030F4E130